MLVWQNFSLQLNKIQRNDQQFDHTNKGEEVLVDHEFLKFWNIFSDEETFFLVSHACSLFYYFNRIGFLFHFGLNQGYLSNETRNKTLFSKP